MKKLLLVLLCGVLLVGCGSSDHKETPEATERAADSKAKLGANGTEKDSQEEPYNYNDFKKYKEYVNSYASSLEFSDGMTQVVMIEFEDSFGFVNKMDSISDQREEDEFNDFVIAISYFDVNFEDGTVGKDIGEKGWDAIKSLVLSDGEFHNKMNELKSAYESGVDRILETEHNSKPESTEVAETEPLDNQKENSALEQHTVVYEDNNVKISFSEITEDGVEFWVENLTNANITIQADTISINGISTNDITMSDDVAPHSKGKVIAGCDDFPVNTEVETVGGQLNIIDFNKSFQTYDATFINVPIE